MKVSVSSEPLAQAFSSLLINFAVAHIEHFKNLVGVQEVLNHLEHFQIGRYVVFGDIQLSYFIVRLEADHQLVESLGGDLVAVDIELAKSHVLVLEHFRKVFHAVIVELRVRKVQALNG